MKALSPQATHKTKIAGVILNVCSTSEVGPRFDKLAKNIKELGNGAKFHGVAIQPMIFNKGHEVLIGSKKDPQFGSVILFGRGGTNTEMIQDVSIGFPPLNQVLARRIIEDTLVYKQTSLSGSPLSIKSIEEALVKLSQLVIDFPEIKEIDINPLIVDQNDAIAVDARIVIDQNRKIKSQSSYEHLAIAPYPRRYNCNWTAKNGNILTLRSIKPEDEVRFSELFKSLSPQTMRYRFFEIIKELSHETLTRYCNLDYDREIAVVAELPENRCIIGVGRLIIDPLGKRGEYAVLVGDKWQGLGVGLKLMETLVQIAKDKRLEKIYGYIMSDNYKMLNLCEGLGFKTENLEDEVIVLSLALS